MPTLTSYLDRWTPEQFETLERGVLVARHRLHETGLFSDEALIDLIDRQPEGYLTIAAMGTDENRFEWMTGERGGCSAADLLRAVREHRIWLNLVRVGRFHPEYRKLIDALYDELEANAPGFRALNRSGNLLISSPRAIVYYHIDLPVNMLWHLRGEKQVWVYPHFDNRFVAPRNIERLIRGEMAEDMPYEPWFEDYALRFHVRPGDLITWPQNAAHRVTNCDSLNVSLSTEHHNATALRRLNVNQANHYLRTRLGCSRLSISPDGWGARCKDLAMRGLNRWQRLFGSRQPEPFSYRRRFVVDPNAPRGFVLKDPGDQVGYVEEQAVLMGAGAR